MNIADLLRISPATVARHFKSGLLPGLKFGKALRSSRSEIEALLVKRQRWMASARFIEPMDCLPIEKIPEGDAWTYELKLDGYRLAG